MQRFAVIPQHYPRLRPAEERARDFAEIFDNFSVPRAEEQSERCLQCGVPFCQVACPVHNHIPDWLRLTAEGRLREAYENVASTNSFPEICGRICPQDRLCEGSCVVEQADFGTITIGSVEKFITEEAFEQGWVEPFAPLHERGESIGIIGAGPAGMAAAEQLRKAGYGVEIYDRHDRIGGLLTYGIPNFKLDKRVIARRHQQYEASGVVFHTGIEIGRDITMEELRRKHAAVLIATGVYKPRLLEAEGCERTEIVRALDYLIASNRQGFGDAVPRFDSGELNAAGKKVVVVGGGDTAMDCVRTAIRQGAESVTCLYRRDRDNMPGSRREVKYAEEEGVRFEWLALPTHFHGEEKLEGLRACRMRLGPPDLSGRRAVEMSDERASYPVDLVIQALGFEAEDLPGMFGAPELRTRENGTLAVDPSMMTSLPGVFAAGDIVRGASLVVWAIAEGRKAAAGMIAYLAAGKAIAA